MCAYDVRVYELNVPVELYVYAVNSEIFASILFAMLKIRDWSMIYGKAARTSFFGQFGASGGGVFWRIIFGNHDKLFTNSLYQRLPYMRNIKRYSLETHLSQYKPAIL